MPTKVALALYLDIERLVETVSGMSTRVDIYSISLSDPR